MLWIVLRLVFVLFCWGDACRVYNVQMISFVVLALLLLRYLVHDCYLTRSWHRVVVPVSACVTSGTHEHEKQHISTIVSSTGMPSCHDAVKI